MSFWNTTGASVRALLTAGPVGAAAGVAFGAAIGGAFLAGGMAQDAVVNVRATRVADAMSAGITDDSLRAAMQGDRSGLSMAARLDPFFSSSDVTMSRQEALLAETLGKAQRSTQATLMLTAASNPAAQPWRANPLDQARQLDCLGEAVYYEARGETPAGQAAVAQVVLNRVRHPSFPKSVCAVVYQGAQSGRCQFSFACDGSMGRNREPGAWARAQRVAERAMGGYVMADVGTATHFHVAGLRPGWRNMSQVAAIGSHVFLRFGGRNGAPGAFTDEPQGDSQYVLASADDRAADQIAPVQAVMTEAVAITPVTATTVSPANAAPAVTPVSPAPVSTPAAAPAPAMPTQAPAPRA